MPDDLSRERKSLKTPTDALIAAMESAEDCVEVIVLATTKDGGFTMTYNASPLTNRMGMIRFAELLLNKHFYEGD